MGLPADQFHISNSGCSLHRLATFGSQMSFKRNYTAGGPARKKKKLSSEQDEDGKSLAGIAHYVAYCAHCLSFDTQNGCIFAYSVTVTYGCQQQNMVLRKYGHS